MELTKAQITILRQQVEKQESVFKEKRYLESLSSPSLLIGRKKEAKKLLELFLQNDGYLVPFASIIGRSGTGKSTLVRLVCESVSDTISFSFTDLRRGSTQFNWVNLMLQELDSVQAKPHEGINKALCLLEERIIDTFKRDSKNRFVLVLDEFDIVFSREYSDFIYKILNVVENIRRKGYWMCVVAISNTKISEYIIDERIRSRINDYEICFSNYSSSDLFEILKDRAFHAFRETVSEDVLKECAKLCATETGDCRHALELLRITGEVPHGIIDSGRLDSGTEYSLVFEEVGKYDYFCMIHPWMQGIIVVKDSKDATFKTDSEPMWFKETRRWFEQGLVSKNELETALDYLKVKGIMN